MNSGERNLAAAFALASRLIKRRRQLAEPPTESIGSFAHAAPAGQYADEPLSDGQVDGLKTDGCRTLAEGCRPMAAG